MTSVLIVSNELKRANLYIRDNMSVIEGRVFTTCRRIQSASSDVIGDGDECPSITDCLTRCSMPEWPMGKSEVWPPLPTRFCGNASEACYRRPAS